MLGHRNRKEGKPQHDRRSGADDSMRTARVLLLWCLCTVDAFYLPGVSPREYAEGELVEMKVNKLTSTKTQLPYEYYSLPFCQPVNMVNQAENLGEVLRGDKIMSSDYLVKMGVEESCRVLCQKRLSSEDSKLFSDRIDEDYRVTDMIVDNLPAATRYVRRGGVS